MLGAQMHGTLPTGGPQTLHPGMMMPGARPRDPIDTHDDLLARLDLQLEWFQTLASRIEALEAAASIPAAVGPSPSSSPAIVGPSSPFHLNPLDDPLHAYVSKAINVLPVAMDQHSAEIADCVKVVETRCSTIEATIAIPSARFDSFGSRIPTLVGSALENISRRIGSLEVINLQALDNRFCTKVMDDIASYAGFASRLAAAESSIPALQDQVSSFSIPRSKTTTPMLPLYRQQLRSMKLR
jgi:hypothetical protein